jgi:hypothetical protein
MDDSSEYPRSGADTWQGGESLRIAPSGVEGGSGSVGNVDGLDSSSESRHQRGACTAVVPLL